MLSALQLLFFYSYGLPLFILNIWIVYILWKNKAQFSSSYYRLLRICGINDIVLYLTNNLFVRLTMYEPVFENFYSRLYENSRLPALMIFSIVFTSHFTHFGMLLLCLNRLSAILYYMSYERMWTKHFVFAVFFMFGGSFFMSFQTLLNRYSVMVTTYNDTKFVNLQSDFSFRLWNEQLGSALFVFIFTALELGVNLATIVIWQRKKALLAQNRVDCQKSLIVLTVFTYLVHLLSFFFNAFRLKLFTSKENAVIAYGIVSDVVALFPGCLILLVSPSFRAVFVPQWIKRTFKNIRIGPVTGSNLTNGGLSVNPS